MGLDINQSIVPADQNKELEQNTTFALTSNGIKRGQLETDKKHRINSYQIKHRKLDSSIYNDFNNNNH